MKNKTQKAPKQKYIIKLKKPFKGNPNGKKFA